MTAVLFLVLFFTKCSVNLYVWAVSDPKRVFLPRHLSSLCFVIDIPPQYPPCLHGHKENYRRRGTDQRRQMHLWKLQSENQIPFPHGAPDQKKKRNILRLTANWIERLRLSVLKITITFQINFQAWVRLHSSPNIWHVYLKLSYMTPHWNYGSNRCKDSKCEMWLSRNAAENYRRCVFITGCKSC